MTRNISFKQGEAEKTEIFFEEFCKENNIEYIKMDEPINFKYREKLLENSGGKCPDFWCKKEGKEIFLEVKTITNITNQSRQDSIEKCIKEIESQKLSGGITSEVFDPIPELKGVCSNLLKDTSKKFKNLKKTQSQARILLINGILFSTDHTIKVLFLGAYEGYNRKNGKLSSIGLIKKEQGLFDKTGSNVSAIVYWDDDIKRFRCLENPKSTFPFSEEEFNIFFVKKVQI